MFDIDIASNVQQDLRWFRRVEQALIYEGIEKQLRHQPDVETRNRKRLRPGHLAELELRVGTIRIFYNVDADVSLVRIVAIGYKVRNKLFFRGQEYSP